MVNLDSWLDRPWVLVLLTITFTAITARGLATGTATLTYRAYKRAEDPALFWVAIVVNALVAVGGLWLLIRSVSG